MAWQLTRLLWWERLSIACIDTVCFGLAGYGFSGAYWDVGLLFAGITLAFHLIVEARHQWLAWRIRRAHREVHKILADWDK